MKFRADVEGLRGVAVLLVFLFHLDVAAIKGGFTGVDIFYVISGFVIFRSIVGRDDFDLAAVRQFYLRRVRRIFPALAATLVACMVVGYAILTPDEYVTTAKTAIAAVFSVSNIYLHDSLNYFAGEVKSMPLVHTWSLGVEEQFYFAAPWLVLLLVRRFGQRGLLVGLAALSALSFVYNVVVVFHFMDERNAFYLPMSRFWEIGAGALAAIAERRLKLGPATSSSLSGLGIAGILASGLVIDSSIPFPGLVALVPVGATVLLILAAPMPGSAAWRLIAAAPLTFLGKISFSLYLFHWPAVVFTLLLVGRELAAIEKGLLLAATIGSAYLSWRFVELPFRASANAPGRMPLFPLPLAAAAITCAGLVVVLGGGLPRRLDPAARSFVDWKAMRVAERNTWRCVPSAAVVRPEKALVCALTDSTASPDYVVWGDSHAGMISAPLGKTLGVRGYAGLLAAMPDCPPLLGYHTSKRQNRAQCAALGAAMLDAVRQGKAPIVVLASRWAVVASDVRSPGDGGISRTIYSNDGGGRASLETALRATVETFTAAGAKVLLFGPAPEMDFDVPNALARSAEWGIALPAMNREVFDARQAIVLDAAAKVARLPGVSVFYPHERLCDRLSCRYVAAGRPLYIDDDHLSIEGVELVLPGLVAAFEKLAGPPRRPAGPFGQGAENVTAPAP